MGEMDDIQNDLWLETHASNYLSYVVEWYWLSGIFDKILKNTKEITAEGNKKIRDKRDVKKGRKMKTCEFLMNMQLGSRNM